MVRVAAFRIDVQRHPSGLGQALEDVLCHARVGLDPELREGAAAEVDRRPSQGVVHANTQ